MNIDLQHLSPELRQILAVTPASSPPPGQKPNFKNPPSRAATQRWITGPFLIIAVVFFVNRVYIKARLMRKWTWDDGKSSV